MAAIALSRLPLIPGKIQKAFARLQFLLLRFIALALLVPALGGSAVHAQPFQFPTANHALLEKGGEEKFFVGTPGQPPMPDRTATYWRPSGPR